MPKIAIIVDNLRVGGVQRLALDEAYSLVKLGYCISIIVLEKKLPGDNIREVDGKYFHDFASDLRIKEISGSDIYIFNLLFQEFRSEIPDLVISHSAKGTLFSQVIRIMTGNVRKFKVIGFIHQLITLSKPMQRIKRLLFYSFANEVRASSKQFILEIEYIRRRNLLYWIVFPRTIVFDRMGIDLDRINFQTNRVVQIKDTNETRLIFLSRVVGWKGFNTFLNVCEESSNQTQKIVFTTPLYAQSTEICEFLTVANSIKIENSGIANLDKKSKALHLYPTNYGGTVKFPQNIGMNVLECIAVGIPSLISREDFWSWPELENSVFVQIADWKDSNLKDKIKAMSEIADQELESERLKLLPAIGIETHVSNLVRYFNG